MPPLQIFGLWLYIVKKRTSRGTEEGGLMPKKPLTNVRIGWISPTEERDHLNIEKVDSSVCCNAHSLLNIWKCENVIQIYLRCTCVPTLKKSNVKIWLFLKRGNKSELRRIWIFSINYYMNLSPRYEKGRW